MRFTWDPAKNDRNIRDRGLDFADAPGLWDAPMLVWIDTRRDYGEVREIGLGTLRGRVMVVGWVKRGDDVHIFSFRKANARETKRYQDARAAQESQAADQG
jgi:uncharacterized DUF497 family protein